MAFCFFVLIWDIIWVIFPNEFHVFVVSVDVLFLGVVFGPGLLNFLLLLSLLLHVIILLIPSVNPLNFRRQVLEVDDFRELLACLLLDLGLENFFFLFNIVFGELLEAIFLVENTFFCGDWVLFMTPEAVIVG